MRPANWITVALLAGALALPRLDFAQAGQPAAAEPQFEEQPELDRLQNGAPPDSGSAQRRALFDLTGYWVAVVTEDWRWRMLTAPRGDYASVPLNGEGRRIANLFDPAPYGRPWSGKIDCRAYGAAALMRMPTRLHIVWSSPEALKVETDWGEQTRFFYFEPREAAAHAAVSAQGTSLASWEKPTPMNDGYGGIVPGPLPGGDLKVVTTHLAAGWLRRNGVPYSDQTQLTEFYQVFPDPLGRTWFDVTTIVRDPKYLQRLFITSSDFRREPDGSKWNPQPCQRVAPAGSAAQGRP